MANVAPNGLFSGYQYLANGSPAPANGVFIPLTAFTGLTAGEADGVAGDGRKVMFEILKAALANYVAIDPTARPARFTITQSTPTGVNATTIRQSFTATFDLTVTDADVTPEA